ncbi:RING finger protein 112-like [Lepisosteus oculatus]|uniref:RING finger protein 112-like n=1 Tax=Lepisosteus oculatus TaxID=7918 RepID=UPI0035F51A2A
MIFNVHADVKKTDLEYLELLYLVAQKGEGAFNLKHFQGFDFLVRDWTQTREFGQSGGFRHLERIIQRLEESGTNKQVLRILREKRPCCHLMPFPGDRLLWSQQGTMQEMNEQFQHCLKEYINHIVQVLQTIQSTVTGKTLAEIFKEVAHVILTSTYRISSPAELIHALNKLTLRHVKQEFTILLNEQRMIMHNTTQGMRRTVELKEAELKARVQGEVSQQDFQKLLEILGSERETFLKEYTLLITREKQEFANFLNEQRRFMPDPTQGMRRTVEQKEFELLSHVQDEVSQQDFQELSEILDSQRETFLKEYTLLIIKRAMQEFTNFLHEQRSIMPDPTQGMRRTVEQKEVELLSHVQGEVSQQDCTSADKGTTVHCADG